MLTYKNLKYFKLKPLGFLFSEGTSDLKTRLIKNSLLYVNKLGNKMRIQIFIIFKI